MTPKKPAQAEKPLTETELELMTHLWKLGEGSVNDVLGRLPKERKLAYTSVSTILRILEQKKIVGAKKEGRGHLYFPLVSKPEYEAQSVQHLVTKVFDGAPSSVVRRLLDASNMTEAELQEIRKILDEKLG